MRMEDIPSRVTLQLGDQWERVRPRLRRLDGVHGDAVALETRKWKVKELVQDGWRTFLTAAQTYKSVVEPQMIITA